MPDDTPSPPPPVPSPRQTLSYLCQTYQALGLPPVVRIPCNDPFEACKALDAGDGVLSSATGAAV